MTRSQAIPILNRLIVAPVTRTVRGIPTEIPLGPDAGVLTESVASFDNLQPIRRAFLTERLAPDHVPERRTVIVARSARSPTVSL